MKRAQTTFQIDLDRTKNVINIFFSLLPSLWRFPLVLCLQWLMSPWVRDFFVSVSSKDVLIQFINLNKSRRHPSSFSYIRNVLQEFCIGMLVSLLINFYFNICRSCISTGCPSEPRSILWIWLVFGTQGDHLLKNGHFSVFNWSRSGVIWVYCVDCTWWFN